MSKYDFVETLKHGKCEGRKKTHGIGIFPYHCVNENAGREVHECPDKSSLHPKSCNCCKMCEVVCYTVKLARNQETIGDMYEEWKKEFSEKS